MGWVRCPRVDAHDPHEYTIRTEGVTVAGGRCEGAPRDVVADLSDAHRLQLLGRASPRNQTYEGGHGGTCYECPFASPPLTRTGRVAPWDEISNDPTEAYFRCSLPTRAERDEQIEWGEYAPCTADEWIEALAE